MSAVRNCLAAPIWTPLLTCSNTVEYSVFNRLYNRFTRVNLIYRRVQRGLGPTSRARSPVSRIEKGDVLD